MSYPDILSQTPAVNEGSELVTSSDGVAVSAGEYWLKAVASRVSSSDLHVSPLRNRPAAVDIQLKMEDEMKAMILAMCKLRTRYNALSLISSLPPEVLSNIFWYHMSALPPSRTSLGWIEATHVCRHWRDAALQDHSLWSNITSILGPQWTGRMLARAQFTPLSITYSLSSENAKLVSKPLYHTRELRVRGAASELSPLLDSVASVAHQLELLEVFQQTGLIICLPPDYFANILYLRHLTLKGLCIPWTARIPATLIHLEIKLTQSDVRRLSSEATLDDVLDSLEKLPLLEELILQNCLPSESHTPVSEDRTISLPRLRLLHVVNMAALYPSLTQYLVVPLSSRVVIKDKLSFAPESQLCSLPIINSTFDTQETPLTILSIADVTFWSLTALAWRVPVSNLKTVGEPNSMEDLDRYTRKRGLKSLKPDVDLNTNLSETGHRCPSELCIENLLGVLPLDDLRYFALDFGSLSWSPEKWIQVLRRCKKVEHMLITNTPADYVGIALGARPDGSDDPEHPLQEDEARQTFSFLPNLRTLVFEDVDFLTPPSTNLRKQVKEALALRTEAGFPVRLRFTDCMLDAAVVESFREVSEVDYPWEDDREDSEEEDSEQSEHGGNEGEDVSS
ncbi:hypothetical protein EVG20_g4705 [Dentipellis fragilis]|uniref:F-box domain-containing protein n=1 Tax=Dentipellis fragilis TaxID=205917 RepID=A0A4Y9YXF8_9AGAM|nr:hypothetical protein EVG20_g4705 [Dentipellis fragilis]